MAQGEVADALLFVRQRSVFGLALPAQSGGAVRFVGDEDVGGDTGLFEGLGNTAAALVGPRR